MARSIWQQYSHWWQSRSASDQIIAVIIGISTILGATYRLVDIRQTMQFLADQGRDAIIALGILYGDIALVGPSTSVGEMYLGPLYYYFMAPFIAIFRDPIGPTLAVAALGILTIPLLYYVGEKLVGKWPAALATLLYTSAPIVNEYARFSWNPNPAPFVSLLLIYGIWRAHKGSAYWWIFAAAMFLILSQLHYVALLAGGPAVTLFVIDLWMAFQKRKTSNRLTQLGKSFLVGVVLLLLSISPLIAFDWKFHGLIRQGFAKFLVSDSVQVQVPLKQQIVRIVSEQHGRALNVFFELWRGDNWSPWYRTINTWLLTAYLFLGGLALWRTRKSPQAWGYRYLALSALITVAGLAWYRGQVFYHYFAYFFPLSYLITACVLVEVVKRLRSVGVLLAGALMVYIFWLSVLPISLRYLKHLGWGLDKFAFASQVILDRIPQSKTYGLANLSEFRDYRGLSYRYFLLQSSHPPVDFAESANADYLVVVAESPQDENNVLNSPVYEISTFPRGDYVTEKIPDGPTIYYIRRAGAGETEIVIE